MAWWPARMSVSSQQSVYAYCNPIEKLWRKLKQEVLHLHRLAGDLATLRTLVKEVLPQFASGPSDLLRYVGLSFRITFSCPY